MPGLGFPLNVGRRRPAAGGAQGLDWSQLDSRVSFARASAATRVTSAGQIALAANDAARFDYDPVSLAARGLRIEGQRTNSAKSSAGFDTSNWSKVNAGVSANAAAAPDGTTAADKLVPTAAAGQHRLDQPTAVAAGAATFSVYAKAAGYGFAWLRLGSISAIFNLATGAIASATGPASAIAAGGGWWRLSVSGTAAGNDTARLNVLPSASTADFAGDAASGVLFWGAQAEAGAFATSYIPTTSAAATRAADVCSTTDDAFAGWLARDAKTVVVQADSPASGTRRVFHAARTGSEATDYLSIWTSDATVKATVVAGGVTQADLALGTIAAGAPFKVALSLAANAIEASLNGTAKVRDTSATIPACDRAWFGSDSGGNCLCGHLAGTWRFEAGVGEVEALAALP